MTDTERAIWERAAGDGLLCSLPPKMRETTATVLLAVLVEEMAALKERVAELERDAARAALLTTVPREP